ncbi:type II secretion system protein [Pseudoduganella violaceinigra]|uniref:type II secretion system protein n=1 Tax=Pseudoduganella violaceinigra TaxID=246602 RepID=UPI0012B5A6F6|nr:type II secretion system protein [Pseudoduganella violaceinigra]
MRNGRRQQGMAYLWMLGLLAVMALLLGRAVEVDLTQGERLREKQLLEVGDEYRRAIASYVQAPGANGHYPRSLEDLLQDPRFPVVVRHLRRMRPDPETGGEWSLLRGPDGSLIGVASRSSRAPHKRSGFATINADFEGKTTLAEWRFTYQATAPAAGSPAKPAAAF